KGRALALALYAGAHRPYSDVDVLVSPAGLEAARGVIAGLGYANADAGIGLDDVGGVATAETWARPSGLMIDLHWQLPGAQAAPADVWRALSQRRALIAVGGRALATLDAPGLALHVALHAAQHGTRYPGPIADLERGVDRWPRDVWAGAHALAVDIGADDVFAAGLRLMPAGEALAGALGLPAARDAAWAIERRYERPRGTFHLEALAGASTLRERASVMRRSLLPRREWIRWEYPWARRGAAHVVAAYAVHLARTPAWALRALRFRRERRRAAR
ncbi:MAG TPA: nucleotidyltransferase family protein, partial [Solirubrobacteraceae bacterium]